MLDLTALEQYVITLPDGGRDTSTWPLAITWPGVAEDPPAGWRAPPGSWGCLQAHLNLWKHLAQHDAPVVVLEDDAEQVHTFGPVQVPEPWDLLMLGGQHMIPAQRTSDPGVVRCRMTMRTHAYVLAPGAGSRLSVLLNADEPLDVQLSQLTFGPRPAMIGSYAVHPWRVGQAVGRSLIDGQDYPARAWNAR